MSGLAFGARLGALASLCALISLAACQAEDEELPPEEVAQSEDEIINGSFDTTSRAVVWLYDENSGSSCTGTIVAVNGSTGYVLTAAHCNNMDYVVIANDYNDCFGQGNAGCEAVFQVTEQIYHPNYNTNNAGQGYDFSMIRFSGANASVPVIPAAQPGSDGVTSGVQVDIVGYGQTESGNNSRRRHKVTNVVQVYGNPPLFEHLSTVCFGDSGGPAILNGQVVGVSSFVTDDACMASGFSGRVANVYNNFIAPYIGGATPPPTCQSCFDGAVAAGGGCKSQYDACIADQGCIDFATCAQNCATQTCVDNCAAQHANGAALYGAIISCGCNVCASLCPECASSSSSTGSGSGSGTGAGTGGSDGVDPEDDYFWYGGKKGNPPREVSTCSATPGASSSARGSLPLLALLAAAGLLRRRRA